MLKKLSLLLVLFAGVFWGSSAIFVNHFSALGFDSYQSTQIRFVFGAPLLFIFLLFFERKLPKFTPKTVLCFAASGICSMLAMCVTYYNAIQTTSAAVAAVLLYTAPIFVMIMSVIFFKEKLTGKKIFCLILVFCGCALTSGIIGGVKGGPYGITMGILSGITYSLYSIISIVALKEGASPLACTSFSMIFAAIGTLFIANPINTVNTVLSLELPFQTLGIMILFALCTAIVPYVLYTLGLANLKPDVASIAASVEPIVATLIGFFILKQDIDIFQILGILAVLSAITVLNINTSEKGKVK